MIGSYSDASGRVEFSNLQLECYDPVPPPLDECTELLRGVPTTHPS